MKRYILYITACLMALSSCTDEPDFIRTGGNDIEALLQGEEMPVRIGFLLPGETDSRADTRASVVGGEEDTADYVKTLEMLCFTAEGIYLGHRSATLTGNEKEFTAHSYTDSEGTTTTLTCWGRELFEGSVPARTARIHFVANADGKYPGNEDIGGTENLLVKSAQMSVSLSDRTICYWGFHGEETPEELRNWLATATQTGTDEDGRPVYTYSKKEGSIVHLIRDRAKLEFGKMNDYYQDDNKISYQIMSISWLLVNGLDHGYIAPYNEHNTDDRFSGYFDETTLTLDENRQTPYDKADGGRYATASETNAEGQVNEGQMMPVYQAKGKRSDGGDFYANALNPAANSLFLFEDKNDGSDPPKIILKVEYDTNGDGVANKTKYHTLMMMGQDGEPCVILRNHSYVLNISGLPWEGLGHTSFDDAVNSVDYANNRTVTIDPVVTIVSNGDYEMSVEKSALLFHNTSDAGTKQTVKFHFGAVPGGDGDISQKDKNSFTVEWSSNAGDATAGQPTVESYNPTTGEGVIEFTLFSSITASLRSGMITVRENETSMSRFINVYAITQFSFSNTGLVRSEDNLRGITVDEKTKDYGNTGRTVGGTNGEDCNTYKMTFTIPGDFPSDLYPIKVRMASTTLNPFLCLENGETYHDDMSVVMESTENGAALDEEILRGMAFETTGNVWNYRATGKPWNYWYTYTVMTKPTTTDADGNIVDDTSDHTYTIYFDDVRALRAEANQSTDLGLFLKIRYFGDAVPVTE